MCRGWLSFFTLEKFFNLRDEADDKERDQRPGGSNSKAFKCEDPVHFVLSQLMHLFVFALTGALHPHLTQVGSDALIFGFIGVVRVLGC